MGILDLALMNDRNKSQQVNNDSKATPTDNTNVIKPIDNVTPNVTDTKDKTIYVDGPISNIITHALNITYANVDKDNSLLADDNIITKPANEEAAIDSTLVAGIYASINKEDELNRARDNDVYVYATDDSNLDNINDHLGDLSIALDKCKAKRKILVMESNNPSNRSVYLLTTYAREHGFEVFYSKEKLLREV